MATYNLLLSQIGIQGQVFTCMNCRENLKVLSQKKKKRKEPNDLGRRRH